MRLAFCWCAVRKSHAPRHVFPELGRAMLMPKPPRDELGYWKGRAGSGRMSSNSNRYSREAEEFLQVSLRSLVLRWIRARFAPGSRPPLAHFAADPFDTSAADASSAILRSAAESLCVGGSVHVVCSVVSLFTWLAWMFSLCRFFRCCFAWGARLRLGTFGAGSRSVHLGVARLRAATHGSPSRARCGPAECCRSLAAFGQCLRLGNSERTIVPSCCLNLV